MSRTELNNNTMNNNTMNTTTSDIVSSIVTDPSWFIPFYLNRMDCYYNVDGREVLLSTQIDVLRSAAVEWIFQKNPRRGRDYFDIIHDDEGNHKLVVRAFRAMYDNNTIIKRKISAEVRRYIRSYLKMRDITHINLLIDAWWREEMRKEELQ
jgi:hypothetical protein